jgi:tetratricopeptide (TPR) repeat protein
VREIGKQLGVTTVLEGSVRRLGNRVRIGAQLVDVRDGYRIFTEVYDRTLEDIFETQDDIARTIVSRLERHFTPNEPPRASAPAGIPRKPDARLVKGHTHDPVAYTEYLRGRYHFWRWSPQSAHKAIAHFERAAALDPECFLPWSGLAGAWTFLGTLGQLRPHDAFPRAEGAAQRALQLEEGAGESHLALASVQLFYRWDLDAAYRSFQRALSLTPGSAEAHHHYSLYLRVVGEMEAAVEETGRSSPRRWRWTRPSGPPWRRWAGCTRWPAISTRRSASTSACWR